MTTPHPFDKLDVDDVLSKLQTPEKVALLTGLDMVRSVIMLSDYSCALKPHNDY